MEQLKEPSRVLKNYSDNKYLVGVSFVRVDSLGAIDRVLKVDPRVNVTIEDSSTKLDLSFMTISDADEDSVDDLIVPLEEHDMWQYYVTDDKFRSGTLDVSSREAFKYKKTIDKKTIYSLMYKIDLGESGQYTLSLNYTEQRYLHGMSMFTNTVYSMSTINALLPYIVHNGLGELPIFSTYTSSISQMNLYPYGFADMVYISDEVLVINSVGGRIGLDIKGAHGIIKITDTGYVLDITLRDDSVLSIYM